MWSLSPLPLGWRNPFKLKSGPLLPVQLIELSSAVSQPCLCLAMYPIDLDPDPGTIFLTGPQTSLITMHAWPSVSCVWPSLDLILTWLPVLTFNRSHHHGLAWRSSDLVEPLFTLGPVLLTLLGWCETGPLTGTAPALPAAFCSLASASLPFREQTVLTAPWWLQA